MMKISQNTKISDLIKLNPRSVDAIASISKPLQKIKNPVLRKLVASRISILEATKIGKCDVEDFKRVLTSIGFVWEDHLSEMVSDVNQNEPNWLLHHSTMEVLDVTSEIQQGHDPLKLIMKSYEALKEKSILKIISPFTPFPLIKLLENRGALTYTTEIALDIYHTYFFKNASVKETKKASESNILFVPIEELHSILETIPQKLVRELDVSGLPMPEPMERILLATGELKNNEAIYVRHRKVPLHLLEELESASLEIFISEIVKGDVRILIRTH